MTPASSRSNPFGSFGLQGKETLETAIPSEAREQVEHVASDLCSRELDSVFRSIFPKYVGCSLDPMHLPYAVDSHTKCDRVRPTVIGLVMRSIMGKFNIPSAGLAQARMYAGERLEDEEDVAGMIMSISKGDMNLARAKKVLQGMNPNAAMQSQLEFAELFRRRSPIPVNITSHYSKLNAI